MIAYRHVDPRFPFLRESADQPAARWHGEGEGPVQYLATTPDAAWAEFIRHEEIVDPADLAGVRRALWAVEVPVPPEARSALPATILRGGVSSYAACRAEARRLRRGGAHGLVATSAAVKPSTPSGHRVEGGLQPGPGRDEDVLVLFGARPDLVAWAACAEGRPRADLLGRVHHFRAARRLSGARHGAALRPTSTRPTSTRPTSIRSARPTLPVEGE